MKKKVLALLTVTVLLVLGITQAASAANWGGLGGFGGAPPQLSASTWQGPASYLGLTDEQASEMQKIQQESYDSTLDLRTKMQKAMYDLRMLGWEKNPDQSTLNDKTNEINDLRNQLYQQNTSNSEKMTSVLTQEQLAKIGQQGFGRGMGMGMGMGMGHRGGMWGFQGTAPGTAQ